jgi:hypothetical protein
MKEMLSPLRLNELLDGDLIEARHVSQTFQREKQKPILPVSVY